MPRILLTGATFSKNKGSEAMLVGTIKSIKKFIPNSNFTLLSIFPDEDSKLASKYEIRVEKYGLNAFSYLNNFIRSFLWYLIYKIGVNTNKIASNKFLKSFRESNVVLDLSGDGFSDDYGFVETLASCYDILICKLLNKPIVIYAQSIGPFNTFFTKKMSKFCLERVDTLIAREKITKKYLESIGIKNKIYLTADSAFLLEPAKQPVIEKISLVEGINLNEKIIIGFSVSQLIFDKVKSSSGENVYLKTMAYLADYLIEKLSATVIFIPHVTSDDLDDRVVAEKIHNLIKNKNSVKLVAGDYSAEETKGIIGKCDLFVGARMHANIAATSMNIPTLAIAYSHKFYGIMEMLEMSDFVYDFRNLNIDDLIAKIDFLWENRFEIRKKLEFNVKNLELSAFHNIELVNEILIAEKDKK